MVEEIAAAEMLSSNKLAMNYNFDADTNSKNYLEDLLKKYNLNNIYV